MLFHLAQNTGRLHVIKEALHANGCLGTYRCKAIRHLLRVARRLMLWFVETIYERSNRLRKALIICTSEYACRDFGTSERNIHGVMRLGRIEIR